MDSDSDLDRSVYQPLADGEGYVATASQPRWRSSVAAVVFVLGIATSATVVWNVMPESVRTRQYTCKRTHLYPSTRGCPSMAICRTKRPDLPVNAKMHRADVGWRFPLMQSPDGTNKTIAPGLPVRVTNTFTRLENRLKREVSTRARTAHARVQRDITVPLAHFCCLTDSEMQRLRPAVESWVRRSSFDMLIKLTRAECWHERPTTVRNGLVGDNTSQLRLFRLNQALTVAVHDAGVFVHVDRVQQMKFHVPLTGFYVNGNQSIDPLLNGISRSIKDINRNIDLNLHITDRPSLWANEE